MTPQERKLVEDLFERLRTLENAPREDDAVDAINAGLDRAPNALYPLVQTVLVQDEALKRADARIRELEAELGIEQPQEKPQGSFLDNMRDALLGREERPQPRSSVPPVRPGGGPNAWGPAYGERTAPMQPSQQGYGQGQYGQPAAPQGYGQPPQQQAGGGSFLGTAAATVAGVVGGAMLMNSMKGMFGGEKGQSHSAFDQPSGGGGASPWGGNASNSDLAKQAGLDDIGRGNRTAAYDEPATERTGLFGSSPDDGGYNGADGSEGGGDFDADFDIDP